MAKEKQIHVIADESLGGVKREYVEVAREAEVGELINVFGHVHKEGNGIFEVKTITPRFGGKVYSYGDGDYGTPYYDGKAYTTLEPTDIVRLREENDFERRFRLVDRKAEEGDKVIVINDGHLVSKGETYTVDTPMFFENRKLYRVLEPAGNATSPQSIEDLIANLATRMSAIERRVTVLEDKAEAQSKQLADIGRSTWYLEDDVTYAKEARYQLALEIREIKSQLKPENIAEVVARALRKGN